MKLAALAALAAVVTGCHREPPRPPPPTDPLPNGWESLVFARQGLFRVVAEDARTWVVDGGAGVLLPDDAWADLGRPSWLDADEGLYDADARDGVLWAVSYDQLAWFDGARWEVETLPDSLRAPTAIVARGDGTVAVLANDEATVDCTTGPCGPATTNTLGTWDGTDWDVTSDEPAWWLNDLTEAADGTLVAVGDTGRVATWDGSDWTDRWAAAEGLLAVAPDGDGIVAVGWDGWVVRGPLDALVEERLGDQAFVAVEVRGETALALAEGALWTDDGTGWTSVALPEGSWWDVAGTDGGALVVGDQGGPTALSVGATTTVAWRQPAMERVEALWVDPAGASWFAGDGRVGRWDADDFEVWTLPSASPYLGPAEVRSLVGTGPHDVLGVGGAGVLAFDGASWTFAWPAPDRVQLWDVAVAPDGTAFATGVQTDDAEVDRPLFLRRDQGTWAEVAAPVPVDGARWLNAVVAFAADDVYALTWREPATLVHFDGASWSDVSGDLGADYGSLWGRSGSDLYVGGGEGGPPLLHWDGSAIREVSGGPRYVTELAGDEDTLLVPGTDGWGDELAPAAWSYQDGVWTEIRRDDWFLEVGARDGVATVAGEFDAWRGPLASL